MSDPNQYPADPKPTDAQPTSPYPTSQYPTSQYPTSEYPVDPYATNPYPTKQYTADPYAATPDTGPRTNVLAIIALVLGIMAPVAGIIMGHIALSQLKRTNEAGHGMALAGTIIGYVLTGLTILGVIAYFAFIAAIFYTATMTNSRY